MAPGERGLLLPHQLLTLHLVSASLSYLQQYFSSVLLSCDIFPEMGSPEGVSSLSAKRYITRQNLHELYVGCEEQR